MWWEWKPPVLTDMKGPRTREERGRIRIIQAARGMGQMKTHLGSKYRDETSVFFTADVAAGEGRCRPGLAVLVLVAR